MDYPTVSIPRQQRVRTVATCGGPLQLRQSVAAPCRLDAILLRAGNGDERAFAQFYDATSPLIFAVSIGATLERSEAYGLIADVYVEAWRLAPTFAFSYTEVWPWLLRITAKQTKRRRLVSA